jgi:hypothetical protein
MPSMAKAVVRGFPHHITQRGNDQQAVFDEHDDHFVERIEGLWSRELKKEGREG